MTNNTTTINFYNTKTDVKRGDIFFAQLPELEYRSSVQQGIRPVLVISNDANNRFSPTINVIPLTSQCKNNLPVHVLIKGYGLSKASTALCEQMMVIDKTTLRNYTGHINENDPTMKAIETALLIQMGVLPASAAKTRKAA